MLLSSRLKSYKSLIILIAFLLIYYGVPEILINFPKLLENQIFVALLALLPPFLMLVLLKIIYGSLFIKWRNFLNLPYKELLKTSFKWIILAVSCNIFWVILLSIAGFEYQEPAIEKVLNSGNNLMILNIVILAIFIAPVAEELTFREAIYNGIRENTSEFTSMIITSLLFAVAHDELWQIPGLFVLGFIFQKHRNHYGNIESAITAHAFNNFLAVALFFIFRFLANLMQ